MTTNRWKLKNVLAPIKVLVMLLSVFTILLACNSQSFATTKGKNSGNKSSVGMQIKPDDTNQSSAGSIRDTYARRFPFVREKARQDVIVDGESQEGGAETYLAYSLVLWFCNNEIENPHPFTFDMHYTQTPCLASVQLPTRSYKEALTKGLIPTYGLPISDTQFQIIDRENRQRLLELFFDPERWMWHKTMIGHMQSTSMANSVGGAAESSFQTAFYKINENLINVANENGTAGAGGSIGNGKRSAVTAVYIVQQMYKHIFVPMAVLLLLPGAVLTQVKGMIGRSFLDSSTDATNPFEGIIRALIAVFLIPSTQLIVSYSVDVGNSLADAVRDPSREWINERILLRWAKEQTFNPPPENVKNGVYPGGGTIQNKAPSQQIGDLVDKPSAKLASEPGVAKGLGGGDYGSGFAAFAAKTLGVSANNPTLQLVNQFLDWLFGQATQPASSAGEETGEGKSKGELEEKVVQESQVWLSGAMQAGFNTAAYLFGYALATLTAYQLVFMCYLFLLGPIAAAFFCWPSGVGSLFRKVFSSWLDAVIVLSLWRFYWCVLLAVMTQRVIYLHPSPGAPMEMMVFNCFLVLLLYVPFQPFSFNPGPMVSAVLDKAASGGVGQGGGMGGGAAFTSGLQQSVTAQSGNGGSDTHSSGERHSATGNVEGRMDQGSWSKESVGVVAVAGQDSQREGSLASFPSLERSVQRLGESSLSRVVPKPPTTTGSIPAVRGNEVSGFLPPLAQLANMHADSGGLDLSHAHAIKPGMTPTVGLVPQGPRILLNTKSAEYASAGVESWRQALVASGASAPSGGGAGSASAVNSGQAVQGPSVAGPSTGSNTPAASDVISRDDADGDGGAAMPPSTRSQSDNLGGQG